MSMTKILYHFITPIFLLVALTVDTTNAEKTLTKILHKEKSLYHDITVLQNYERKCLTFTVKKGNQRQFQGCQFLKTPDVMVLPFSKLLMAGVYLNPQPQKILVIGMGIGTVPTAFTKLYPDVSVDTVDIDPVVFKVAKEYFDFKESDRSHVFIQDGRMYVKHAIKKGLKYDIVILDAFNGDYIPEHLLTKEFLEEVKEILTPAGVIVSNTFSMRGLYPNESVTYEAVFGKFYNLKHEQGNRIIVAQKNGIPPLENVLVNAVSLENRLEQFGITRDWLMTLFSTDRDWPADARILTDQYSPANLLNANEH